ncbi:ankyrin repeat domain-containing protein [Rickettsia canadensis]|uniref:30S ribosomal protein S21 n=1 Tax=Rickettsia canadensis str. CA410 TaxID=1105107 RepID=A0ABM5MRN3_RICCA|nr:hypothetical protein [Rickettsia canadensis]AFB20903.1 30S ribosomal protein S21 [Rickettsia canadensis str. CA410]
MQKILLKGRNVNIKNPNPNIKEIKTLAELPSGTGHEYFINLHGSEIKSFFKKDYSFLYITGLSAEDGTKISILDITLLNNIQNGIHADQCNIVHIYSCYSGAAQHHLNCIHGNIVLCTYNKASDVNVILLAQSNYDARIKNDSSLIEYIRDNFHLLAASDFSISYKLDDQIYNFSLSADEIKKMKSIEELPAFLHKAYDAFVKFYTKIYAEYHESYPEIFNLKIEPEPKALTHADLIRVFNRVVVLEVYNFNKSSLSNIKTMLNQEGLNINICIDRAIKQGNCELLICLLNYYNTNIKSNILDKAIERGDLNIVKIVLEHSTTKINSYTLSQAIERGDINILKAVLEHSTTQINSYTLSQVIERGDINILKAVLEHSTTEINSYTLSQVIERGDINILKAVLEHSTTQMDFYNLAKVIKKGDLNILKVVLEHTTKEVEFCNLFLIYQAIEKGDVNILKAVLEHSTTQVGSYTLNQVIERGDVNILKAILEHSTTKIESYNLAKVVEKGDLNILKAVLEYNTKEVEFCNLFLIYQAIEKGNVNILKAILEHSTKENFNLEILFNDPTVNSYNNTAEETNDVENTSTINTMLNVVEEVAPLGESSESSV